MDPVQKTDILQRPSELDDLLGGNRHSVELLGGCGPSVELFGGNRPSVELLDGHRPSDDLHGGNRPAELDELHGEHRPTELVDLGGGNRPSLYLSCLRFVGRGQRNGEEDGDKDWPGLGLDRDGQEPLALAHLMLLHLAEWCAEGPLRDLKGNTEGWCGLRVLNVAGGVVSGLRNLALRKSV